MNITAQGIRGVEDHLTQDKIYTALHGLEEGIFSNRPFVTVIDDNGKTFSCHASRFVEHFNSYLSRAED